MKLFGGDQEMPEWASDLSGERARIVRLCARLTGSRDAAEDLAQETLFETWRSAPRLRDEASWRAFVSGIARNLCLRWLRREGRDRSRRIAGPLLAIGAGFDSDVREGLAYRSPEFARDPFDIEEALEASERAALVDRALGALPPAARELLQERYMDDLPQSEIAARHGLTENAAGVRIHRARAALRQAFVENPALAAEAAAWGLGSGQCASGTSESDSWQESRIWCPRCSGRYLEVRFARLTDSDSEVEESAANPLFAVRCPDCREYLGFDFTSAHAALDTRRLLAGIRGFKPALNRLHGWWSDYYATAVNRREAPCPICGDACDVTLSAGSNAPPRLRDLRGLFFHCRACRKICCTTPSGLAFHLPQTQAFYRANPRICLADERKTVYEGRNAVQVTLQSRTASAHLDIFLAADDLSLLAAHS